MKGPKPSHVRRTVVLAGAQMAHKNTKVFHRRTKIIVQSDYRILNIHNSQQFAGYRRATVKYGKFLEYKRILWNYAFMSVRLR